MEHRSHSALAIVASPAKLNLFLHIIGQRPDRYHRLQTVFQLIDLNDTLSFYARTDDQICLEDPFSGIPLEQNLIIKAAYLLREQAPQNFGVTIHLNKVIPMGAGMGGGSSNAAMTLRVLNKLWNVGLSSSELATLGLKLGADVPVFVHGHNAFGEGVGEILTPMTLPERWYIIIIPPVHVNTAQLFAAPDLPRNTPAITLADYLAGVTTHNDFLPVLLKHYPEIKKFYSELSALGLGNPQLTGSGSAFFFSCENFEKMQKYIRQIPSHMIRFVAKGLKGI